MDSDIRTAVLNHVNQPNYRPVKPKVIAKKLGLVDDAAKRLKIIVKKLVRAGKLAYGPGHLVCPADRKHPVAALATEGRVATNTRGNRHLRGTFRQAMGGYGFVRPEEMGATADKDADIYIAAKNTGDAANGDFVSVRLDGKRGRMGKIEGRIIDVLERATNQFVGTYFEQAGMGLVQVDGKVFSSAIYVGDPGAKGVKPDDKVVIEMVRFPSHVRDGEGVIVDILGAKGKPGVDTMSIVCEFSLPGEFADNTIQACHQQADQFDESIGRGRRDLTAETIITVDPKDARDFDDAISLERIAVPNRKDEHWLLGVHIADVSHFVRPKTALDREAYDRATSVYLPDKVIPMLPEVISNNLASLQPNKVRYAMTALIEMTADGTHVATDVFKSAIKSRKRFTYEQVDQYLAETGRTPSKGIDSASPLKMTKKVHALLGRMHELAMILRNRRFERGTLEITMPQVKIDLNDQGQVCGAHAEENTESHQIIEEFMLAANEAVAQRLSDQGVFFLRRVHGDPDPRKLKALTEFVRGLGLKADNLQSRFELQRLLKSIRGDPREHAVNYAVLRSMQRAVYSPDEAGHYALSSDCYCHFTSPIRRYPDLTIHRLLDTLNRGKKPEQHIDHLIATGDHCSEREQRATQAERELTKVKLLNFLTNKIGLELDGIITGVERFGLFITGTQLPAEGFIHISALADDHYRYDRTGHVISGFRSGNEFRLGDAVRVAVAAVDVDARELDFRLLQRDPKPLKRHPKKKKRNPGKRRKKRER
ncbi:MAG: ribonuclease R [Pirellulales bacterium]|nr:ribonuclease R [Pirellulales bacterium]